MTKNNWRALILLLVLMSAVSTAATLARRRMARIDMPAAMTAATDSARFTCIMPPASTPSADSVDVPQSLPARWRNTQPNRIEGDSLLAPAFDTLAAGGRPLRVLHLGDSHVASGDFTAALRHTLQTAWGSGCVSVSYLAKNGATAEQFTAAPWTQKIKAQQADLIIVSFGTNECHGMGYREEQHREQLRHVLSTLRELCPDAVVLLTTPPGDYLSTGRGRRRRPARPNPMVERCAAEIVRFSRDNGLAVWDLHTIAGGSQALTNYLGSGLMQRDRVHFTAAGYTLFGHCLGEALLTAYNDGKRR